MCEVFEPVYNTIEKIICSITSLFWLFVAKLSCLCVTVLYSLVLCNVQIVQCTLPLSAVQMLMSILFYVLDY